MKMIERRSLLIDSFGKQVSIPNKLLKHWSRQAKACYFNGCMCSRCLIPKNCKTLKGKCRIKNVVLELVKKFGAPKRNEEAECQ